MNRIIVEGFKIKAKCACNFRVERYKDEKKNQHGVMILGKPCPDEDCDGRRICAEMTRKWKTMGGTPRVINGEQVH